MSENDYGDKYDTRIYVDFTDLPDETKKELFAEWTKKNPQEDRVRKIARFAPIIFAIVTALFLIASAIVSLAVGFGAISITLLSCGIASLVTCIVLNEWSARMLYDQSVRYASWLKSEKRILAELKPRKDRKKK